MPLKKIILFQNNSLYIRISVSGYIIDLVVINRSCSPQQVTLAELTMTWDTTANMNNAKSRKEARYEFLTEDIQQKGLKCNNLPFEIGVGDI